MFNIYLKITGIVLFVIFFAYTTYFFSADIFRRYDKPTLIFLLILFVISITVNLFLEKKYPPNKLAAKDLIFLISKFLILITYAAIQSFLIKELEHKKIFLLHFLIYAVAFLISDTIIQYQIINKK